LLKFFEFRLDLPGECWILSDIAHHLTPSVTEPQFEVDPLTATVFLTDEALSSQRPEVFFGQSESGEPR
jgi:hypothetical protein